MNQQDFLKHLKDPVGNGIDMACADFRSKWNENIDVLNVRELDNLTNTRQWYIQIFTTDSELLKLGKYLTTYMVDEYFTPYIHKYNSGALVSFSTYNEETCMISCAILIHEQTRLP